MRIAAQALSWLPVLALSWLAISGEKTLAAQTFVAYAAWVCGGLWWAAASVVYLGDSRDDAMRAKRFAAVVLGLTGLLAYAFCLATYYFRRLPAIGDFGALLPDFPGLLAGFTGFAAAWSLLLAVPILALSLIDPAAKGAWVKAAGTGVLWGLFLAPPFPERSAMAPGLFILAAVLASGAHVARVALARLDPDWRRRPLAWAASGLGMLALLAGMTTVVTMRFPTSAWDIPELAAAAVDEDFSVRRLAQWTLAHKPGGPNQAMTRMLAEALDPASRNRVEAISEVRSVGIPERGHFPALLKLLGDPDPVIRTSALKVLGSCGPLAAEGAPAIARVLREAPEDYVRREAAWALGELQAAETVADLARTLRDQDSLARDAAAHSLAALGPRAEPALPELLAAFGGAAQEHAYQRRPLLTALVRIRSRRAAAAMRSAANDPDKEIRELALQGLGLIGDSGPLARQGRESVAGLLRELESGSPQESGLAALKLGTLGVEEAVPGLMRGLGGSQPGWYLHGLGRLGPAAGAAVPAIVEHLKGSKDLRGRREAVPVLLRIGTPEALAAARRVQRGEL